MTHAVAIVGPTGSGKTALAIAVAEALDSEIISADSMQFYKGLAIGTGQPTPEELARVPHHFVASFDLSEETSAGKFQREARAVVDSLISAAKVPVIEGGSGLYLRALIDGIVESPPKDDALRARLESEAATVGPQAFHDRLKAEDPHSAGKIEPADVKRVVRALEVLELTGQPISALHAVEPVSSGAVETLQFGVEWPRDVLYDRINRRVDAMFDAGFVEEVTALLDSPGWKDVLRLRPIGYREVASALRNEISMEEAREQMKMFSRRYAKRQLTWFRRDERINWLPGDDLEFNLFHVKRAMEDSGTSIKPFE